MDKSLIFNEPCFKMIKIYQNYEPIPGYKVIEKMGSGGFGEVWKCTAPGGLLKAIKFVPGKLGEKSDIRAEQEWRALDRIKIIRHPFILSMERIDVIENCLVIVMELADKNLWTRYLECKDSNLPGIPKKEALHYLKESAEALDVINSQYKLQHLDIKPQNLFLVHNHLKIGDFGLVHDLTIADQDFKGGITPIYSAPELIEGRPSRFSDQYSLAVVYQEMTTGKRPFQSENLRTLIKAHLNEPPDLSSLDQDEKHIVGRALSKKPEDRFNTCMDFIKALSNSNIIDNSDFFQENLSPNTKSSQINFTVTETATTGPSEITDDLTKTLSFKKPIDQPELFSSKEKEPLKQASANAKIDQRKGSLIIGLGKTGMGALSFFSTTLKKQAKSSGLILPFDILGIDIDHQGAISGDETIDSEFKIPIENSIICKLNRPNYYLGNKEKSSSLSKWLPLSKLYQIPKSLSTDGNRILGKLAILDASEKLKQQLELNLNKINQIAYSNTMPGKIDPVVWITTHTAGGAAGSLMDICKMIAVTCQKLALNNLELNLLLVMPSGENITTQMITNTILALQEIQSEENKKHFNKIVLLARNPPNESSGYEGTMHDAGMIIYTNQLEIYYQGSEINKNFTPELGTKIPSFKSAGVLSNSLSANLNQQTVLNETCLELIKSWIEKKPIYAQETNIWLEQELLKNNITLDSISTTLTENLEEKLGQPIESFVLKDLLDPLFFLESTIANKETTSENTPTVCLEILKKSERLLGSDWYSEKNSLDKGSFQIVMNQKKQELVERFGAVIDSWVVQWIEKPGYRFAGAEAILAAIHEKFAKLETQLSTKEEKHFATLKVDLIRLNNILQQHSEIKNNFSQTIQKIITQFISLFRTQIEVIKCTCISSFIKTIILQINDHFKELENCKTKLLQIGSNILKRPSGPVEKQNTNDHFRTTNHLNEQELQSLDAMVQENVVNNFEAFTQMFIGSESLLGELEKLILLSANRHLKNLEKLTMPSILESLKPTNSKTNFIKNQIVSTNQGNLLHSSSKYNPTKYILTFPRNILGEWNIINISGEPSQSVKMYPGNDDFIACVCEEDLGTLNSEMFLKKLDELFKKSPLHEDNQNTL